MQYQKAMVYIKQFRLHVANKYLAFADRLTSRLTKKSMSSALIWGSFKNEALENEDRSTLNLENEAP